MTARRHRLRLRVGPRARWGEFLGSAIGALQKRQRQLKVKELTTFSDEQPLDLMVIDELVAALTMRGVKVRIGHLMMDANEAFLLYASQVRAAGHTIYAASQLPHADVIGRVRPLFSYATCLRVGPMEQSLVDVVLGRGASERYPAHQIPPGKWHAGIGYTRMDHGGITRYRAAYLTDEERRQVVETMRQDTARLRAARKAANARTAAQRRQEQHAEQVEAAA